VRGQTTQCRRSIFVVLKNRSDPAENLRIDGSLALLREFLQAVQTPEALQSPDMAVVVTEKEKSHA